MDMENYVQDVIESLREHMRSTPLNQGEIAGCLGVSRYRIYRIFAEPETLRVNEMLALREIGVKLPELPEVHNV